MFILKCQMSGIGIIDITIYFIVEMLHKTVCEAHTCITKDRRLKVIETLYTKRQTVPISSVIVVL